MPVGELCTREVVVASPLDSVLEAAQLMRQHHVGDVVIVEHADGLKKPVGLVTDRDLVVEVMAAGIDPESIALGEIMSAELAMVGEEKGIFETIQYMRDQGVRRLPVVGQEGQLIGILALDDLLELISEELSELSHLVKNEERRERRTRL
jgi:signal-transduction protein with cAMP-binding, CBS, and nucleotidyltransferase domain